MHCVEVSVCVMSSVVTAGSAWSGCHINVGFCVAWWVGKVVAAFCGAVCKTLLCVEL